MSGEIQVGVIGLGRSGWDIHCNIISKLDCCFQVLAVCELNKAFTKQAKEEFSCRVYYDIDSMLRDSAIDLVVVATPTKTHFDIAKAALKNNKHVIIEKPICSSMQELIDLYEIANDMNRCFFPFYNFRYRDDYTLVRKILASSHLGKINTIRNLFQLSVGFLDHTEGDTEESLYLGIRARYLNAFSVEKHIVLDRSLKGIDYQSVLSMPYFKRFIKKIRNAESALGEISIYSKYCVTDCKNSNKLSENGLSSSAVDSPSEEKIPLLKMRLGQLSYKYQVN